jgi:hypothetical protein
MDYIVEEPKKTPVTGYYDVVIAGGGVAGIAAGLAAARRGASVCILEKENVLGGLATLALIAIYLPLCDGCGNQIIHGIGEELLKLSVKYGGGRCLPDKWLEGGTQAEREEQRYQAEYNPWLFAIAAEELLLRHGVRLMFDTRFSGVAMEGGRVAALIAETKGGRLAIGAGAVVDASGDADICFAAGEETAVYGKNRLASWYYRTGTGGGMELCALAVPLYGGLPEGERQYHGLSAEDISEMNIEGRRRILADILKRRIETGDSGIEPAALPLLPPMRMTRRLTGLYELDESEERVSFPDAVGMTGDWRKRGPVFSIPYRCLYGAKAKNLLAAGRCISVTESMWDITRAIPACAVTGEAAGAAAALVSKRRTGCGDICIRELQDSLRAGGVALSR